MGKRPDQNPEELTAREEDFIREYVTDFNATRAYIAAGYSKKTATPNAHITLNRPIVQQRIKEILEEKYKKLDITADKVLKEIARIAFFDPRKIFDDNDNLKHISCLDDDEAAVIAGLDVSKTVYKEKGKDNEKEETIKRIKLADKLKALELLGKHLVLFTDKTEVSNKYPDGIPQIIFEEK